ncbi:MAG TPA: transposase [Candidatus Deferrimicrobiaceae bacterium]|nr:transposase [Candidatus Deferrimicrobiaceae bacterium]
MRSQGPCRESLERFARQGVQRLLQQVLGQARYERRDGVDATPGYRNGFGKPRRLSAMAGTITVRRPRVRGLEGRFESQLLPLFKRRTEEVGRLLPELYLHGLAHGDFDLALRGLLGEAAPLSAASIARLKAGWQVEYDTWKHRRLDELEPVYVWADGIYVKAGLEQDKAAMLVLIAALRDGRKVVLAVESGSRESTESWAALLRDLKARGLRAPRLLIADGHLGIWGAVRAVFPAVSEQRCWNHRLVNVLDTLPQKHTLLDKASKRGSNLEASSAGS